MREGNSSPGHEGTKALAMVILRFLELLRWRNLLILIAVQWLTFFFLNRNHCYYFHITGNLLLVNLSTITIAGAGYLINDYFDLKIDAVNKPGEIIIEKFISRRWALFLQSALNIIGILAGLLLSAGFGLVNLLITVLLWLYSAHFKKTFLSGNILVAFLMALSLPVVVFTGAPLKESWLLFYAFFAFLTGFIREIIKDVEDIEGDAQYNSQTVPIKLGFVKAKKIILALSIILLATLAIACSYLFIRQYFWMAIYLILLIGMPMLYFLRRLRQMHSIKQFHWASAFAKGLMLVGMISMVFSCLNGIIV
jgi:4-hydroxybenzoate polyprenyltransferase